MFNRANDVPYKRFMKRLHESLLFDWYMEVGCRTGSILAMARGKSIGVDPYFLMETNIVGVKPRFLTFQETSDDFFASRFLETNKIKLSFSFLDGMHLYEYLLRDFINTEKNSKPGGVIAMHDCCPYDSAMTTRDLENLPRGDWTGDVWKMIPILQRYRPDLKITVLGCAPTGVVLVSDLNPKSTVLSRNLAKISAEFDGLEIEDFGVARFYDSFEYAPARGMAREGFKLFSSVALSEEAALTPEYITP